MAINQETSKLPYRKPKRSRLLTIAAEIRLNIYEHVFADLVRDTSSTTKSLGPPALMQVCRLMREESVDAYNGYLSAVLQQKRAQLRAAESSFEYIHAEDQLDPSEELFTDMVFDAECFVESAESELFHALDVGDSIRRRLRKQGFKV